MACGYHTPICLFEQELDTTFNIIWPERRTVSAEQIDIWFADAVANGDAEESEVETTQDKARFLDDLGYITLGK